MTICAVYIGDLDDPSFHWDGGDWNGNVPRRLSLEFPQVGGHYNECFHRWVDEAGIGCRQTDYGGWVARVSVDQLMDYIGFCYAADSRYTNPDEKQVWQHLNDRLDELCGFISTLESKKEYALVATEF